MATPLVITYDNAPTENTRLFLRTLEKNKWNYKLIGEGETWRGFITKLNGCANYIRPTGIINGHPKGAQFIIS